MANPIKFVPKSVDPKLELQRRLAAAPNEHAEALLVAYDLLEEAHRQGILDALHGAIGAKDTIVGLIAEYSVDPLSVNAVRNTIALAKIVGTMHPEPISRLSKEMMTAIEGHRAEQKPPSLWERFKRVRQPQTRRGLSLMTRLLTSVGKAGR